MRAADLNIGELEIKVVHKCAQRIVLACVPHVKLAYFNFPHLTINNDNNNNNNDFIDNNNNFINKIPKQQT